jgi:signal peptidase I
MVGAAVLAAAVLLGVLARRRLLLVTVAGNSMLPAFADGDVLLALAGRRHRVGDVVVFRTPPGAGAGPGRLVKRVAATAGDRVPADVCPVVGCATVPDGRIVVRGDNPTGLDSRRLGFVDATTVDAVVWLRLLPQRSEAVRR